MKIKILLTMIISSIVSNSYSQNVTYDYYSGLNLELGRGIDIKRFSSKILSPFKVINPKFEKPTGTQSTTYSHYLIANEKEIDESLSIGTKLKARYIGVNVSAEYKLDKSLFLKENTLTICIAGETNFGRQGLDLANLELTDQAKEMRTKEEWDKLIRYYGDYICTGVERASRINLYLTIENVEKSVIERLSKSAKVGGLSPKFSGQGEVSINKLISSRQEDKSIKLSLWSNGDSTGFSKLRPLVYASLKGVNPIENATSTLVEYLKDFNRDNSAITKFLLVPISGLGVPEEKVSWNSTIERAYEKIAAKYDNIKELQNELNVFSNSNLFIKLSTVEEKKKVKSEIISLNKLLDLCRHKSEVLTNNFSPESLNAIIIWADELPERLLDNDPQLKEYKVAFEKLQSINSSFLFLNENSINTLLSELRVPHLAGKKFRIRLVCVNQIGQLPFYELTCFGYKLNFYTITSTGISDPFAPIGSSTGQVGVFPRRFTQNFNLSPVPIDIDQEGNLYFSDYFIYETSEIQAGGDNLRLDIQFDSRLDLRSGCQNQSPLKIFPLARIEIIL